MIAFLIEHPKVSLFDFLVEPLPIAILVYIVVWLVMRPKEMPLTSRMIWWHVGGVVATLLVGAVMRLTVVALHVFFDNVGPALLILNQPGSGISTVFLSLFGAHHYLSGRLSSFQGKSQELSIPVVKGTEAYTPVVTDPDGDAWLVDIRSRLYTQSSSSPGMLSQIPLLTRRLFRPLDASGSQSAIFTYASPWKRLGAGIIDIVVSNSMVFIFILAFAPLLEKNVMNQQDLESRLMGIGYLGVWLYFAAMESSKLQATLGKMAFGIKVTDIEGGRIDFWKASGRHWGKLISLLLLLIGFVMIFFTQKRQGLHDMMARCIVVNKQF